MSKSETKFELLAPADTAAEKQLDVHKKNIRVYSTGVLRSGAQMCGYAFLAGNEMNAAAALLPHGDLTPWLKQNFPEVSERTARNWRGFAETLNEKFKSATVADFKNAKLLTSPTKPKKSFTEKECAALSAAVREAMDGKGMIEFLRDAKLVEEEKEQGGVRVSNEKLQAWLKEHHPDLVGKTIDELPKKIQNAALRDIRRENPSNTAVDQAQAANDVVEERTTTLIGWTEDEDNLKLCTIAKLRALEKARVELGHHIQKILKARS
jgi:hypothetical protein